MHEQHFAITVENYGLGLTMWLLWYHMEGQWEHQDFLEECNEVVGHWFSMYGHIHKVARSVAGRGDVYMALEELEERGIARVVYKEILDEAADVEEYRVILALQTPVQLNWS